MEHTIIKQYVYRYGFWFVGVCFRNVFALVVGATRAIYSECLSVIKG